jgi:preprotein translocase subunit SecG
MLIGLITFVHIVVCLILIVVVLLQSGKGADLAGAFGGASQTAFGPRGAATWASRATTISAILFMVTSISLAILQSRHAGVTGTGSSVMDKVKDEPTTDKKAAPPVPTPVDQSPDSSKGAAPATPSKNAPAHATPVKTSPPTAAPTPPKK